MRIFWLVTRYSHAVQPTMSAHRYACSLQLVFSYPKFGLQIWLWVSFSSWLIYELLCSGGCRGRTWIMLRLAFGILSPSPTRFLHWGPLRLTPSEKCLRWCLTHPLISKQCFAQRNSWTAPYLVAQFMNDRKVWAWEFGGAWNLR